MMKSCNRDTQKIGWVVAPIMIVLGGCTPPPPPVMSPESSRYEGLERYFPLDDGRVYTYETTDDLGGSDMMMLRVRRTGLEHAQLETGSGVKHLLISKDGIQRENGGFVLRAPLVKGASWKGDNGGTTSIVEVDHALTVPAGSFVGCIRTVEEVGSGQGRITTVYCPEVGLALMEVEQWDGADHGSKRFELRSYGSSSKTATDL